MSYIRSTEKISFYAYNSSSTLVNQYDVLLQFDTSVNVTVSGTNDTVIQQPRHSILIADARCESNWGSDPRVFTNLVATSTDCINTRSHEMSGTSGYASNQGPASDVAYSLNEKNIETNNSIRQRTNDGFQTPDFEPYENYSRVLGWRVSR